MAAMTLLNQDRMVAGCVALPARWSSVDAGFRFRELTVTGAAHVIAATAVKPIHGYARRPSEGSS